MSKMTISERERFAVFRILDLSPQGGGGEWGGDEATLLLRDELYQALALDAFESEEAQRRPVEKFSDTQRAVELSREVVEYLVSPAVLSRHGQSRVLGRLSARLVRRCRTAFPKKELAK